jgi:hypothetical protein
VVKNQFIVQWFENHPGPLLGKEGEVKNLNLMVLKHRVCNSTAHLKIGLEKEVLPFSTGTILDKSGQKFHHHQSGFFGQISNHQMLH